MGISIGSGMQNFAYPVGYSGPGFGKASGEAQVDTSLSRAIADLKDAAVKTPAERARDAVLEKHGLDEKGYAALESDARKAIDKEIADAIERTTGAKQRAESTFLRLA